MNLPKSPQARQRTLVALATLMFLLSWTVLLARVIHYWQEIPSQAHYWAVMFAALYPCPWLALVSKNRTKVQMAILTYFALFAAMKFIFP
jgi:hypothetical protein